MITFVSPDIIQKFTDLKNEIAEKSATLKELYGIEEEGAKIAAMHNAYKVMKIELDEAADQESKARQAEKVTQIAQINAEIKEAQDNLKKTKKELDEEEKQYKKDLAQLRSREAEEFKYNLDRTRVKENDAWADEKAAREKVFECMLTPPPPLPCMGGECLRSPWIFNRIVRKIPFWGMFYKLHISSAEFPSP